jgi:multidrug resistance protein, MATE family
MNRNILRLAIPNIISNITVPLLGIIDLAMMGRLGSEVYIGAIAVGGMIFNFIYWGFSFLRMGTTGFVAQAYGAGNYRESANLLARAILIAILASVLILALQIPIEKLSFLLIDSSPEVTFYATNYFYIRVWAAPATISLYAITGWFIGMQNTIRPMIIAITVNLTNIVFNLIFVFGFGMKSDGVAFGTVLAQYTGVMLALFFLIRRYKHRIILWEKSALLELEPLRRFYKVNKDIFLRTLALIFTITFFTARSAAANDTILAVNTILFQFFVFFSYFVDGFANAGEALTGRYIGAGKRDKLSRAIGRVFLWSLGISLIFTIVNLFGGKTIFSLLTTNEELINAAAPFLFWIAIIPLISFTAFIWDGIYIGATVANHLRNSVISGLVVFLAIYYLTKNDLGNHGLWLAFTCFLLIRGIYLSLFARKAILW